MKGARTVALALAVLAMALVVVAGPGTKAGWWEWTTGIALLRWGATVGMAAAVLALGLLALLAVPKWRVRPWVPLLALCVSLAAVAPPLILRGQARAVPPIHDITTDPADPPGFVALREAREKSPNGAAYGGSAVAAAQQQAYGDLRPLTVKAPPRETLQRALDAARAMGWEVVGSDAAAGRIEATATTRWFGFRDDVVIRIRPEGEGSRVDVRSASRVGVSDLGANAARIREFLAKLA